MNKVKELNEIVEGMTEILKNKSYFPFTAKEVEIIEKTLKFLKTICSHAPEGRNYTNEQYVNLLLENERLKLQIGELFEENTHLRLIYGEEDKSE